MTDATPNAGQSAHNLKGKSILWVEDDKFLKGIISHKLTQEEVTIYYANEGQEAIDLAIAKKPDLIVLDILLPGLDGVDVLRRLKESSVTKDIPVVMFSNVDDKARVDESQKLGSSGFFVKTTMTIDEIIAELSKVISKQ